MKKTSSLFLLLGLSLLQSVSFGAENKRQVLLVAGRPSHAPGEHEHNAGVQLLAKCLKEGAGDRVEVQWILNGEWPAAETLAKAHTLVLYSDGGAGHVASGHWEDVAREMQRGCGLVCLHYAVEPAYAPENWPEFQKTPEGKPAKQTVFNPARSSNGAGTEELGTGLGGYFEQFWSVNPHWTANFQSFPKHPIANGVQPFSTLDEWYYHMRFRKGMKRVTPILSDLPPPETTQRGEGPHSGNPEQKQAVLERKEPQHVAWAVDREDGGRGFGFTGGHFHAGWGNENQRKLVLNAILWTAQAEVPEKGLESKVSETDMVANLDPKPTPKPKPTRAK